MWSCLPLRRSHHDGGQQQSSDAAGTMDECKTTMPAMPQQRLGFFGFFGRRNDAVVTLARSSNHRYRRPQKETGAFPTGPPDKTEEPDLTDATYNKDEETTVAAIKSNVPYQELPHNDCDEEQCNPVNVLGRSSAIVDLDDELSTDSSDHDAVAVAQLVMAAAAEGDSNVKPTVQAKRLWLERAFVHDKSEATESVMTPPPPDSTTEDAATMMTTAEKQGQERRREQQPSKAYTFERHDSAERQVTRPVDAHDPYLPAYQVWHQHGLLRWQPVVKGSAAAAADAPHSLPSTVFTNQDDDAAHDDGAAVSVVPVVSPDERKNMLDNDIADQMENNAGSTNVVEAGQLGPKVERAPETDDPSKSMSAPLVSPREEIVVETVTSDSLESYDEETPATTATTVVEEEANVVPLTEAPPAAKSSDVLKATTTDDASGDKLMAPPAASASPVAAANKCCHHCGLDSAMMAKEMLCCESCHAVFYCSKFCRKKDMGHDCYVSRAPPVMVEKKKENDLNAWLAELAADTSLVQQVGATTAESEAVFNERALAQELKCDDEPKMASCLTTAEGVHGQTKGQVHRVSDAVSGRASDAPGTLRRSASKSQEDRKGDIPPMLVGLSATMDQASARNSGASPASTAASPPKMVPAKAMPAVEKARARRRRTQIHAAAVRRMTASRTNSFKKTRNAPALTWFGRVHNVRPSTLSTASDGSVDDDGAASTGAASTAARVGAYQDYVDAYKSFAKDRQSPANKVSRNDAWKRLDATPKGNSSADQAKHRELQSLA